MTSMIDAITGIKAIGDIAQSLISTRDAAIIQGKTSELQSAVLAVQTSALAAQSEQLSLIDRVRNLEEEIARVEAWDAEKKRYHLNEVVSGVFTYILKEEADAGEPLHQICANCYDVHREKSSLQQEQRNGGMRHLLVCNNCGAEIVSWGDGPERHRPLPKISTRRPR